MKTTLSQSEIKKRLDGNQIVAKDWADFNNQISKMSDTAWIFRGVSSPSHYPIPSIGREKQYGPYKKAQELRLFKSFKDRAVSLTPADFDEWQMLAYAQHLGVPTRLLDWSTSPLIAAFFALEADNDEDRLIFCLKYSTFLYEVKSLNESPFDNKSEGRFSPPILFDRLRSQRGVFTVHPDPTKIFYRNNMRTIRIKQSSVPAFRKKLFKYGIDYWHIYPDTEGLGKQLKWQYANKIGLGSLFMKTP